MPEQQQASTEGTEQSGKAADAAAKDATKAGGEKAADDGGSKDSGQSDAKSEAQLKVNRDLETKLNQLRDGLKSALGIEDKKDGNTETLISALQEQLNSLTHTNLVSDVARRHKITDDEDIALLSDIKDKDAMEKLAARIAPQGGEQAGTKTGQAGRNPRPDPSQGSTGSGKASTTVSAGRDLWAERHPTK